MPKCGKKCPSFCDVDCNFNPDATRRCELPHRVVTTVSTRTAAFRGTPPFSE